MARQTKEEWQAIRTVWEYDTDEPSLVEAAARAATKHGFSVNVTRQMLSFKSKAEEWERKGTMVGIVQAAHRKADAMEPFQGDEPPDLKRIEAARVESEDKRAKVLARHRAEWEQVVKLRQEALAVRKENPDEAFNRSRLAKITAEITMIQQGGERKAWALDENLVNIVDIRSKTDDELRAIALGRSKPL